MTAFEATPADLTGPRNDILPFRVAELRAARDRLLRVTAEDLKSFIAVRKTGGSADNMLTALYGANLGSWHREAGRIEDNQAQLFYDAGQLYGMQLCEDRYWEVTEQDLIADDGDAYAVAKSFLKSSYDHFDLPDDTPRWEREKRRELAYTGTDHLSIMNAALYPHVEAQLKELYGETGLPMNQANMAFYTGLIDAVVFVNAYTRFRNGLPPQVFEVCLSYAPPLSGSKNLLPVGHLSQGFDPFDAIQEEVEPGAAGLLDSHFAHNYDSIGINVIRRKINGHWMDVTVVPVVLQTGPNQFETGFDVIDVQPFKGMDPRRVALKLGGLPVAGLVVANGINVGLEAISNAGTSAENASILGLLLGTGAGIYWFVRGALKRYGDIAATPIFFDPPSAKENRE